MAVIEIEDVLEILQPGQTIAGLDLGTKTIGLAVSDLGLSFANPRPVIKRAKFTIDAQVLLKALEADKVGVIIIGLPMNMDGTAGPRVQATRAFVRTMQPLTDLPFVLGRTALDGCCRTRTDWYGCFSRQAGRTHRFSRCIIHSARRIGSPAPA